jgi:DNA end-binding protein Ku
MAADEGVSTKTVVAGAALGLAIPAAVTAAKKLRDGGDQSDEGQTTGSGSRGRARSGSRSSASRSTAGKGPSTQRSKSTKSKSSGTGSGSRSKSSARRTAAPKAAATTREQLYRQATRLGIEGRSRMTKAQLERAVGRARGSR